MDNNELLDHIQQLLEGMERRVDKRMLDRLTVIEDRLTDLDGKLTTRIARIETTMEMFGGIVSALTPIVINHDTRLRRVEDRRP